MGDPSRCSKPHARPVLAFFCLYPVFCSPVQRTIHWPSREGQRPISDGDSPPATRPRRPAPVSSGCHGSGLRPPIPVPPRPGPKEWARSCGTVRCRQRSAMRCTARVHESPQNDKANIGSSTIVASRRLDTRRARYVPGGHDCVGREPRWRPSGDRAHPSRAGLNAPHRQAHPRQSERPPPTAPLQPVGQSPRLPARDDGRNRNRRFPSRQGKPAPGASAKTIWRKSVATVLPARGTVRFAPQDAVVDEPAAVSSIASRPW